jgi:hypothetical protein
LAGIEYLHDLNARNVSFPRRYIAVFGVGLAVYFWLTILISPTAVSLGIISCVILFLLIKNDLTALLLYIAVNALSMVATRSGGYGVFYALSGGITSLIILTFSLKLRSKAGGLLINKSLTFYILYFLWGTGLGILGLLFWENSLLGAALEASVCLPFIVVPVVMYHFIELRSQHEKVLFGSVILLWIILLTLNLLKIRNNIAAAFYLYETGRATFDIFIHSLLFFIFISVGFCIVNNKKLSFLLMCGIALCVAGIVVSFYRTIYLADMMMIPVLFLLTRKEEKRDALKFLALLSSAIIVVLAIMFIVSPLFSLLVRNYLGRLLTSSQVTTDPSLVNRYVEWRGVLKRIGGSPIIGFGFGGSYLLYGWIVGFSTVVNYTHNGYLYIILKTGVVGFILLVISYGGIILLGIRLSRDEHLLPIYRAFARGGTAFLISLLIINNTINVLTQRDGMLWSGVVFGYFLICEKYLARQRRKEMGEYEHL